MTPQGRSRNIRGWILASIAFAVQAEALHARKITKETS